MNFFRVAFLFLLFLCLDQGVCHAELTAASSENGQTETATETPVEPRLRIPGISGVDVAHKVLSTQIENLSQYIDSFFGERRIYEEATGTYIQMRGSLIYGRGGDVDFDGKFRAKVDFPQLEEKVNLVLESSDEEDDLEDINRITTGTSLNDELNDNDFETALQFVIREKDRWNVSLRPGLKLSSKIKSFVKLRFRRQQRLGKKWLSRVTNEVRYYSDKKWEDALTFDFERYIGDKNFFRTSSTVLWRERDPGNQLLGQVFQITRFIDKRRLVSLEIGTNAETKPVLRDTAYFSSIRYRRNIHHGWLFFEIKPQVIWARVNNFEADPALVLTLEALLGARMIN